MGAPSSEHCYRKQRTRPRGGGWNPARPRTELGFLGASVGRAALARVQGRAASSVPNAVLLSLALCRRPGVERRRGARYLPACAGRLCRHRPAEPRTRFSFKVSTPLLHAATCPCPLAARSWSRAGLVRPGPLQASEPSRTERRGASPGHSFCLRNQRKPRNGDKLFRKIYL